MSTNNAITINAKPPINLIRKTIVISKIEKNVEQYSSTTNYREKRKSSNVMEK